MMRQKSYLPALLCLLGSSMSLGAPLHALPSISSPSSCWPGQTAVSGPALNEAPQTPLETSTKHIAAVVNDDPQTNDTPLLRLITIRVAPYGDVIIDGEPIGRHVTHLSTRLFAGKHTIKVRNPYGRTITKKIYVNRTKENPALFFHIQPKPAHLTIQSNVDADISVAGELRGRSWTSEVNPIVVPLDDDWRGRVVYDIVLTREGYEPNAFKGTFRAGTKTVLKVHLKSLKPKVRNINSPAQSRYKTTIDNLNLPLSSNQAEVRID